MPSNSDNTKNSAKIQLLKFSNRLKARLGFSAKEETDGFIDPKAIAEADQLIEAMCIDCPGTLGNHLKEVSTIWDKMKTMHGTAERADMSRQVFTLAHEIKDVASLCKYELLAHFAESLRDYIGLTDLNIDAQVVIIQAHLDAMNIAHKSEFKEQFSPEAEELKRMVRKAIDKYH